MSSVDTTSELIDIPSTSLYKAALPGRGEMLYFLRWDPKSPPQSIRLSSTWADSGLPTEPGYLLFFSALIPEGKSASVETQLRTLLDPPTTTAFAWITLDGASGDVAISTLVKTKLNASSRPIVDGDTAVKVPAGMESVVFPDGALLQGVHDNGELKHLVSSYSPSMSAHPPSGPAVSLPLAGGPSGKLVGCIAFKGLTNALGNADDGRVLKSLMDVAFDPLNPLDPARNYQIFTGQNFWLVENAGKYHLLPYNS